jgi:2-desacetyl-2-hydroxyethyl bacteriochlorophyllide A dehydrogenase
MGIRVVFTGKQKASLEEFKLEDPRGDQVRVRSICSLMSTGTENIVYNRLFEPGTHWDRWVKYPFHPGYSMVGEIEAAGEGVKSLKVGDRVVIRNGHASHHTVAEHACAPVPKAVATPDASWFALAKIASMGARAASYTLGDDVLVIGAGPIGQMTTRWARASGAENIIVVDPVSSRLELATRGGATSVISTPIDKALDEIKVHNHGELPKIVVDTTGNEHVFAAALTLVARHGKLVLLGDTGSPSRQHLTSDVVTRGVTITGAHDGLETGAWNAPRIYRLFFNMVSSGRFDLSGLITHTFAPLDFQKAYDLANTRRGETMGILFDWTKM